MLHRVRKPASDAGLSGGPLPAQEEVDYVPECHSDMLKRKSCIGASKVVMYALADNPSANLPDRLA
jgi:hypothetical protein